MQGMLVKFNRPFSHSESESGLKDISLHFVEFSNVTNSDRNSNAKSIGLFTS